jgi:L-fuconolactonase
VPALNRRHLIADYRAACGPVAVGKMVFVQCDGVPAQFLAECDWVTSVAREDSRIRGIVPFAPLERGAAVAPALEQLAANPLVKGVRRLDPIRARPRILSAAGFRARGEVAAALRVYVRPVHHPPATRQHDPAGAAVSEVTFILDHIAKPDIKAGVMDPWRAELRELAALPNVGCKLSGLATEADHARWAAADLRPYIDHVMTCFGPDRVLFGVTGQSARWRRIIRAGCKRSTTHSPAAPRMSCIASMSETPRVSTECKLGSLPARVQLKG